MTKLMTVFMVAASLNLSACVTWPALGSGGVAEHTATTISADESIQSITPEQGLFFEFELVKQHLDIMILEGARYCFPATVVQAQQRQNRIIRELNGDLELDAANDLIIQRNLLTRLEQQLDYVTKEKACTPPSDDNLLVLEKDIQAIADLLNNGQQFEDNSDVLTQHYTGQLAEASFLLRDLSGLAIHITGHVDSVDGNEQHALSLARTQMIQRYLQVFGINPKHIHITAIDNDNPIFEQHVTAEINTKRRVTIELVELYASETETGE
jgi:outer membrane protein OmpA-like peptidoglycan-associated protein